MEPDRLCSEQALCPSVTCTVSAVTEGPARRAAGVTTGCLWHSQQALSRRLTMPPRHPLVTSPRVRCPAGSSSVCSLVWSAAPPSPTPMPSLTSPPALPGIPWPTEFAEQVIAVMKEHEKILDIQLCACSLLLRILGQGGRRAGCYTFTLAHSAPHRLCGQAGAPPSGPSRPHLTSAYGDLLCAR